MEWGKGEKEKIESMVLVRAYIKHLDAWVFCWLVDDGEVPRTWEQMESIDNNDFI